MEEGAENRSRRFIRWTFSRRLGANKTPSIMEKLRQRVDSAFYIRNLYAYVIVNVETGVENGVLQTTQGLALD